MGRKKQLTCALARAGDVRIARISLGALAQIAIPLRSLDTVAVGTDTGGCSRFGCCFTVLEGGPAKPLPDRPVKHERDSSLSSPSRKAIIISITYKVSPAELVPTSKYI